MIVGGLRDRLIHDSLYNKVKAGLTALGWFNPNPTGFTNPITLIPEQVPWDQELTLNTITISPGMVSDEEFELGNYAYENKKQFYIDVYGENEALSIQLSGDIRDVLRGKFEELGYFQPTLDVYDYRQASPPWLFFCDVEHIQVDRTQNFPHLWQRYLYTLTVVLCDYYGTDQDATAYGQQP